MGRWSLAGGSEGQAMTEGRPVVVQGMLCWRQAWHGSLMLTGQALLASVTGSLQCEGKGGRCPKEGSPRCWALPEPIYTHLHPSTPCEGPGLIPICIVNVQMGTSDRPKASSKSPCRAGSAVLGVFEQTQLLVPVSWIGKS